MKILQKHVSSSVIICQIFVIMKDRVLIIFKVAHQPKMRKYNFTFEPKISCNWNVSKSCKILFYGEQFGNGRFELFGRREMLSEIEQTPASIGSIQNCLNNLWRYKYFIDPKRLDFCPSYEPWPLRWAVRRSLVEDQNPFIKLKKMISSWIMECKWWNRRSPFQTKFKRLPRTITGIDFIVGTREKEYWVRKRF